MQLLMRIPYHFFRYDMTTADEHGIENFTNTPFVLFARLVAINLHYGLFEELVESLSPLSIFDKPKDSIIGIHYE